MMRHRKRYCVVCDEWHTVAPTLWLNALAVLSLLLFVGILAYTLACLWVIR